MKSILILILFMNVNLNLAVCCYKSYAEKEEDNLIFGENVSDDVRKKSMKIYNDFLNGKLSVEGIDIDYITIPKGEPDKRYSTIYTFFDSNGDKLPELHIKSLRYYYVFTIIDNELKIWADLVPNHCVPLNDRGFMRWKCGGAPMYDTYVYELRDFFGEVVFSFGFGKYDKNKNGVYDENDYYVFMGAEVDESVWNNLTRKYLCIDEDGKEDICNKLDDWITLIP